MGSGQNVNGIFHRWLLTCLCQLLSLTLEQASVHDSIDALKRFDSTLQTCLQFVQDDVWRALHHEMQAQLFYHAGTLLLKRALHVSILPQYPKSVDESFWISGVSLTGSDDMEGGSWLC